MTSDPGTKRRPWSSGPEEILQHGLSLLARDTDRDRRLAMLSIDNAVELTIKTFLGLPERATGLKIKKSEYEEFSQNFGSLLNALEKHASGRLAGVDLADLEWYHRLRNQLYHQGNGLTVDRDKVIIYGQLAKTLFANLFGYEIAPVPSEVEPLSAFLATWARIDALTRRTSTLPSNERVEWHQNLAVNRPRLNSTLRRQLLKVHEKRNRLVHNASTERIVVTPADLEEIQVLERAIRAELADPHTSSTS